jgi:Leucine-rich repeat (LRR) protein
VSVRARVCPSRFPKGGLASLPHLVDLGLARNPKLSALPPLDGLRALQTLTLSKCNFSDVPMLAEALQGGSTRGLHNIIRKDKYRRDGFLEKKVALK